MTENILPIGSVVRVKNRERKLMVHGILQSDVLHEDIVFDYTGVPYPEGHTSRLSNVGFNQEDIEEILHRGYEDEERDTYMELVEVILQQNMRNLNNKK